MQSMNLREILEATGGSCISGNSALQENISNICTDSRNIIPGSLFIPLLGERFDGHDYIKQALESGANASLTHKDIDFETDKVIIKVNNTLSALRELAAYYRSKFNIPFVAVTGSVGKTSTKDMITCVLQQELNTLKTQGNFNNEIGVPLTIFTLEEQHQAAVVEMGMSDLGEISRLTSIVGPDIAIITNIGLSHIENLGSKEKILQAKMEIIEGLKEGGLLILNGDDELLKGLKGKIGPRTLFFGMNEDVDYRATDVISKGEEGVSFKVRVKGKDYTASLKVPGVHNVYNVLAAIAVGVEMGIPMNSVLRGINSYTPGNMRMNIIQGKNIKIINDSYNASPQSMEAAIKVISETSTSGRKIAVLGDMLELGNWAKDSHYGIGKVLVKEGLDALVTVGENARYIAKGAVDAGMSQDNIISYSSADEAAEQLTEHIKKNDVILVKGSRGMMMEKIVDILLRTDI
jgi:UDP-N-acetylmuramoyl-tripeptide--D-alanyl-D-alanine ligase